MTKTIALIPVDVQRSRLGLPSRVGDRLAGKAVLAHTLSRVAAVDVIDTIVLVHPAGQNPLGVLDGQRFAKPVEAFADESSLTDPRRAQRSAARKWSLGAWRGGLGGATCYDELLPAGPLAAAMRAHDATSALLVGADWPLVDPDYRARVLGVHLENPEAFQLVFTQAPPGLAGVAVGRGLVEQLAEHHATLGSLLAYNPVKAQADPIGRDVCVQIDPAVRSCATRFVYDTPGGLAIVDEVADALGPWFDEADAGAVVGACEAASGLGELPQQVTLELTPRRAIQGPIAPQHHVAIDRPAMSLDLARRLIDQVAQRGDAVLTLGGLGDALMHDDWRAIVAAAHEADVFGLVVETDLQVDGATIDALIELPIDVISVRLNADRAETYRKVCGRDDFAKVVANLERLLSGRNQRGGDRAGLPWVVPRLVKTADTLADMETFFDRWMHFTGQAVIDPPPDGCGAMPDDVVGDMPRPRRRPCRQAGGVRVSGGCLTVFSDGLVPYCDEDWLCKSPAGNACQTPLADIWRLVTHVTDLWDDGIVMCGSCRAWYGAAEAAVLV